MKTLWSRQERLKIPALAFALALMALFALWMESRPVSTGWARAGYLNYSAGLTLLFAFALSRLGKPLGLPYITGYLFAGMLSGPYVAAILEPPLVEDLRLSDDLALGVIGLVAGATLRWDSLKEKARAIFWTIGLHSLFIAAMVLACIFAAAALFPSLLPSGENEILALAMILAVLCVARSPSSAIAVMDECRAEGPFTETILSVTVAVDALVILLFAGALGIARGLVAGGPGSLAGGLVALPLEMAASVGLGILCGLAGKAYMERSGRDVALFALCLAFGVSKAGPWLAELTLSQWGTRVELAPLIVCMSAGFTLQNASRHGQAFLTDLGGFTLPVYLLFFSLAGASLRLDALAAVWPLALALCCARAAGLFLGGLTAGAVAKEASRLRGLSFLGHLTQAGVSIGLAQLAARSLPSIGSHITTLVLAVIAVNQIVGPVALKWVLGRAGETCVEG